MTYQADRIFDTSTSTGTGTVTLTGTAPSTFVAWAAALGGYSVGDIVEYAIVHQSANEFEIGTGVLVTSTTISRTNEGVENSSLGPGVLVNFSAGTKDVFSPYTAKSATTLGQQMAIGGWQGF